MIDMFYTYAHYKKDNNEIFYIGKGKGNRYKLKDNRRNIYWKRIVAKHGIEPRILAYWNTEEEALSHEKLLISCFRDMGYKLTNLTDGGEGVSGLEFTEKHKQKLKIARQGKTPNKGKKHSEEARKLMSINKIGNKNCLGNKHSEEARKKMSLSKKFISDETRLKMSISAKNRYMKKEV